jgi:hypothetical protein
MAGDPFSSWTAHLAVFSVGVVLGSTSAWWAITHRNKRAATAFATFAATTAVWCLAAGLKLLLGAQVQCPLEVTVGLLRFAMSVSWFLFALRYTGYWERVTPGIRNTLAGATLLVVGLLATDPLSGLYYAGQRGIADPFVAVAWAPTALGSIGTVYGFLLAGIGTFALLYRVRGDGRTRPPEPPLGGTHLRRGPATGRR